MTHKEGERNSSVSLSSEIDSTSTNKPCYWLIDLTCDDETCTPKYYFPSIDAHRKQSQKLLKCAKQKRNVKQQFRRCKTKKHVTMTTNNGSKENVNSFGEPNFSIRCVSCDILLPSPRECAEHQETKIHQMKYSDKSHDIEFELLINQLSDDIQCNDVTVNSGYQNEGVFVYHDLPPQQVTTNPTHELVSSAMINYCTVSKKSERSPIEILPFSGISASPILYGDTAISRQSDLYGDVPVSRQSVLLRDRCNTLSQSVSYEESGDKALSYQSRDTSISHHSLSSSQSILYGDTPVSHQSLPYGHTASYILYGDTPVSHQSLPYGHTASYILYGDTPVSHQSLPYGHTASSILYGDTPVSHQSLPYGHTASSHQSILYGDTPVSHQSLPYGHTASSHQSILYGDTPVSHQSLPYGHTASSHQSILYGDTPVSHQLLPYEDAITHQSYITSVHPSHSPCENTVQISSTSLNSDFSLFTSSYPTSFQLPCSAKPDLRKYINTRQMVQSISSKEATPNTSLPCSVERTVQVQYTDRKRISHRNYTKTLFWFCESCDLKVHNIQNIISHMKGKKHQKSMKNYNETCQEIFHISIGIRSIWRKKELNELERIHHQATHVIFVCTSCDVHMTSGKDIKCHMNSAKHRSNLNGGRVQNCIILKRY